VGELQDIAITETNPQKEGNQLHTILAPRPGAKPRAAAPAAPVAPPAQES
jgi:hypothetical protein